MGLLVLTFGTSVGDIRGKENPLLTPATFDPGDEVSKLYSYPTLYYYVGNFACLNHLISFAAAEADQPRDLRGAIKHWLHSDGQRPHSV